MVTRLKIRDVRIIERENCRASTQYVLADSVTMFFCIFGVIFRIPPGWMLSFSVSIIEKSVAISRSPVAASAVLGNVNGSFFEKIGHLTMNNIRQM
jgi:hypothetical protein